MTSTPRPGEPPVRHAAGWHASPHVRACLTGDSGVLMDVRGDRVYSLDRIGATIWFRLVAGETPEAITSDIAVAEGAPLSTVTDDLERFVRRLEQKGLLEANGVGEVCPPVQHSRAVAASEGQGAPARRPAALLAHALWRLLRVDLQLTFRGLEQLHRSVADYPTHTAAYDRSPAAAICRAVDRACALYPRQALCLQRSAAATYLLRDHGVPATLVIGTRKHPFRAHAWVEVDGTVVNDKRGVKDYYQELDRL